MQTTIQQSLPAHTSASDRGTHQSPSDSSRPHPSLSGISVAGLARGEELLALLPGRAALLDASGLVIAWNDETEQVAESGGPRFETAGMIVAPLGQTGITLIWAPPAEVLLPSEAAAAPSHTGREVGHLMARLLHAQEDERKRIARELHDDLSQRLAAHALALSHLKLNAPVSSDELQDRLLALESDAIEMAETVRMVSHKLHPALLERYGLAEAIKHFASDFCRWADLQLIAQIQPPANPPPEHVAIAAYRIAQEALRNIERHAHARTVHLKLRFTTNFLHLSIKDDGVGIPDTGAANGLGLVSIEERVNLLGGRFSLTNLPVRGAHLSVHLPLNPVAP